MIGHSPFYKGYKCLNSTDKVYIAIHVHINESEFPYSKPFPLCQHGQNMPLVQKNHIYVPFVPSTIVIRDNICL